MKQPMAYHQKPKTDCEWMFGDAATGLLGFHEMAGLNPLRWSGSKTFQQAIQDIRTACAQKDRPIIVKVPSGITSKENLFNTSEEAIQFLQSQDPTTAIMGGGQSGVIMTNVQAPAAQVTSIGAGGQSYVMPEMFASPGLTMVPNQLTVAAPTATYTNVTTAPTSSVVYAAPPTGSVTYAAAPAVTYGAGSVTYAPAEPTGSVTYAAAPIQTMTYASPATYTTPIGGQPTYHISPERFQLIMQGQPLTNEEIAQLTGQAQAAPIGTQGGASFAMPDMFASPGLTMVGGNPGQFSGGVAAASTIVEPAAPAASTVATTTSEVASSSKKKDKKSDKKSSKKKLSSKKKSKGCC